MPQAQEVAGWIGREVVDASGDKIGTLEAIYLDAETDQPEWALIKTGLLGGRSLLVPLSGAAPDDDCVRVAFPKDQVKDAPSVKADEELSQQEEARLYEHYGLEYSFVPSGSGLGEGGPEEGGPQAAGVAATKPGSAGTASEGDAAVAQAEAAAGAVAGSTSQSQAGAQAGGTEQDDDDDVRVRAEKRPRERVRLKKYVVTEYVTKTVPVEREPVRVEREPVDESRPSSAADA